MTEFILRVNTSAFGLQPLNALFKVPGNEGKAGMAAIYDPDQTLNLKNLAEGVKKALPPYARPLFVRVLSKLPMTGNKNKFYQLGLLTKFRAVLVLIFF